MPSSVVQLAQLISQGVASLQNICSEKGLNLPELDDAFTSESEAFRSYSVAAEAALLIGAAALQLAATVMHPSKSVSKVSYGTVRAAALRVCLESNVPEILREAGPQGLHIDRIAAAADVDGVKLGRMLRYLATEHIFREISPDVFANNRLSSFFDTGKSSQELQAKPETKHDGSKGFAAVTEFGLEVVHKSTYYTLETMRDPVTKFSGEPNHAPFNRAFKTSRTLFEWLEEPEQSYTHHRFGLAMSKVTQNESPDGVLSAFDWKSLPDGATVVDVGGGIGTFIIPLAEKVQHLNLVIQDRAPVIEKAKKIWESRLIGALNSGRVKLQAHDFFNVQPIKNASVFTLKHVLHDWSDEYASKILIGLREAATATTKLLLIDPIIPYACSNPNAEDIPGAVPKNAPLPLLPNYGAANNYQYASDLLMFTLCNAQERTMGHLSKLLQTTGWRIIRADRSYTNDYFQPIEAVPI